MNTSSQLHKMARPSTWAALLALGVSAAHAQEAPKSDAPAPIVVPFEMLPSNHMVVEVKLNDEGPYNLIFDVGSPVTLLGTRAARGAGLIKNENAFTLLFNARGAEEVDTVKVGDLVAKDVPVLIMDHPVVKALGQILGKPLDGLMGHSFFARYRTTIDYQAKTMAFEPVDNEIRDLFNELPDRLMGPKRARRIILEPAALFGISVQSLPIEPADEDADDAEADASTSQGVIIRAVVPDSPAAQAGLKPDDLLTTLDGRWTLSVADLYDAAANVEPGRPVTAEILRDGQLMTLSITPVAGF